MPAVTLEWNEDPTLQLRALVAEIDAQNDFPKPAAADFMLAAFDALERLPATFSPAERAEGFLGIARYHYVHGTAELGVRASKAAVRAAVLSSNRSLEGRARLRLATDYKDDSDFFAALPEYATALELARAGGDRTLEAKVLNNLGGCYTDLGLYAEALDVFHRSAAHFISVGDKISAWMALDNAAVVALESGEIQRGIDLANKASEVWCNKASNAFEALWIVQGMYNYCRLLIKADRIQEALLCARNARVAAALSGHRAVRTAKLVEVLAAVASGSRSTDALIDMVNDGKREDPTGYDVHLELAIEGFERAGEIDTALSFQRELLAFRARQQFSAIRRVLGHPSPAERKQEAKLIELETWVDRTLTELVQGAVIQSIRTGHDEARIFRVSSLACRFAKSQGLADERLQTLELAIKLMDIGSMAVSDRLLCRTSELSKEERELIEEHAAFGAELLQTTKLAMLEPCLPIVRFHHERWDGSGPNSLAGLDVPLEARIAALCDAFDSLTHARPWRPAQEANVALQVLEEEAGSRFDPDLCLRFVSWVRGELLTQPAFGAHDVSDLAATSFTQARRRIRELVQGGVR